MQAAYLLNGAALLIVKTSKCPEYFKPASSGDCYFLSDKKAKYDEAKEGCAKIGELSMVGRVV